MRKLAFPVQITEQDIRRLAIGYLRLHYKYRPRKRWNGIEVVDRRHEYEGIVIDARLTYEESNDKVFVATVEASSIDKSEEVYYRHHWFRLLFESLTLALLVLAIVIGPLAHTWYAWLQQGGVGSKFLAGFYLLLAFWTGFMMLLQAAFYRRYRYIYAVEQFKLFHADDQWIAFDTALFETHGDKRFQELEWQCVRYGFGIMEIERDRDVRVLVAPKRGDYFGNKRRQISSLAETLGKAPVIGDALGKRLGLATEEEKTITFEDPFKDLEFSGKMPTANQNDSFERSGTAQPAVFENQSKRPKTGRAASFKARYDQLLRKAMPGFMRDNPGFFNPPVSWRNWFLLALILNVGIIVWQIGWREIEAVQVHQMDDLRLERSYDRRVPTDLAKETEMNNLNTEPYDYSPTVPQSELGQVIDEEVLDAQAPSREGTDVMYYQLSAKNDTLVRDVCPRFGDPTTKRYALVYGRYNSLDAALDAAFSLHKKGGLDVNVVAGNCLQEPVTAYLIMMGLPSANEGEVNLRFRKLRQYGVEILGF